MDDATLTMDRVESDTDVLLGVSVGHEEPTADFPPAAADRPDDCAEEDRSPATEAHGPPGAPLAASGAAESDTERAPQPARVLEALLFSADTPLSLARLAELLELRPVEVRLLIGELNDRYTAAQLAFRVEELAGGYQLLTLPIFEPWLRKLNKARAQTRLSSAALEALAIVAYKQPIIRADIEAIRGAACGEVLNRLREMGLVRIVGRAEIIGRPMLYGTTRKFLDIFGLANLEDLPPMEALSLKKRLGGEPAPAAGEPAKTPARRSAAAGA
jgi:segregation and condensation protein B